MSDPNSLSARRRSLARLLDYALNEAEDLELGDVAHFVTLAATILQNMRKPPIKRRRKKASRDTVVHLAEFREQQGAMLGRSSSRRRK
jgi:hypothetical protein